MAAVQFEGTVLVREDMTLTEMQRRPVRRGTTLRSERSARVMQGA